MCLLDALHQIYPRISDPSQAASYPWAKSSVAISLVPPEFGLELLSPSPEALYGILDGPEAFERLKEAIMARAQLLMAAREMDETGRDSDLKTGRTAYEELWALLKTANQHLSDELLDFRSWLTSAANDGLLGPPVPPVSVVRVSAKSLSYRQFLRQFASAKVPVIITDIDVLPGRENGGTWDIPFFVRSVYC
jgi:hypothetical protein